LINLRQKIDSSLLRSDTGFIDLPAGLSELPGATAGPSNKCIAGYRLLQGGRQHIVGTNDPIVIAIACNDIRSGGQLEARSAKKKPRRRNTA
jgi:hypothetical protein